MYGPDIIVYTVALRAGEEDNIYQILVNLSAHQKHVWARQLTACDWITFLIDLVVRYSFRSNLI